MEIYVEFSILAREIIPKFFMLTNFSIYLYIIIQAVTDKVTATTIQFRFVNPTDTGGLPIEAYAVEYKESMQQWNEARRRVWPQSKFVIFY